MQLVLWQRDVVIDSRHGPERVENSASISAVMEASALPYQSQLLASPVVQTHFDTAIETNNV
jgi:hypothetical protein